MKKFMIKYKLFGMLSLMVLPLMLSCSSTDDGGSVAPIIKPEPPSPYTGEIGGEFELGVTAGLSTYEDNSSTRLTKEYDADYLWHTTNNLKDFAMFFTNPAYPTYTYNNCNVIKGATNVWYWHDGTTGVPILCQSDSTKFAVCGYAPYIKTENSKTSVNHTVCLDQSKEDSLIYSDFLIYPEDTIDPDWDDKYPGGCAYGVSSTYPTSDPSRPGFNVRVLPNTKLLDVTLQHGYSRIDVEIRLDGNTWPSLLTNPLSDVKGYWAYTSSSYDLTYNSGQYTSNVVSGLQGPIKAYEYSNYISSPGGGADATAYYSFIIPPQTLKGLGIGFYGNDHQFYFGDDATRKFEAGKVYTYKLDVSYNALKPDEILKVTNSEFTVTPWNVIYTPNNILGTE